MIIAILTLILITLVPALELRMSIPMGIFGMEEKLSWPVVVLVCTMANIILGWLVFAVIGPVFTIIRKWDWFEGRIWPILERTRHKIHPYVEKYGYIGVALFIGVPLPGSGVYTGAFGSYLLGMKKRHFAIANVLGVLIAATAVTVLCMMILHGAVGEDSLIAKLFIKNHAQVEKEVIP
ncbi:MAG: small multi-drug export protein [Kiritimatiellae bacterium]|nr:small multi-drug export protein [Kiritimatiellia bacterium]